MTRYSFLCGFVGATLTFMPVLVHAAGPTPVTNSSAAAATSGATAVAPGQQATPGGQGAPAAGQAGVPPANATGEISVAELAEIQKGLKATPFLSVNFTQSIYKDLRKTTSVSQGRAHFRRPNAFRWVLEKPKAEEWIFNGTDLWHYQPLKKQAQHYGANATRGRDLRQIVDIVVNFDALLREYKVNKATREGEVIKLALEPQTVTDIQAADLKLDLKKNYVSELVLHFRGQNRTTFQFTNPSTASLGEQTFAAPNGVKVLDAL